MSAEPISERAASHVAAFNATVHSGDWADFPERFAPDATKRFVGIAVGPYTGREAKAAAYASQPPSDTLTVVRGSSSADVDELRFVWDSSGAAGTMTLRWSGALIAELSVAFS